MWHCLQQLYHSIMWVVPLHYASCTTPLCKLCHSIMQVIPFHYAAWLSVHSICKASIIILLPGQEMMLLSSLHQPVWFCHALDESCETLMLQSENLSTLRMVTLKISIHNKWLNHSAYTISMWSISIILYSNCRPLFQPQQQKHTNICTFTIAFQIWVAGVHITLQLQFIFLQKDKECYALKSQWTAVMMNVARHENAFGWHTGIA